MCGVVSIVYKNDNKELGNEAIKLLKKLEYRGYDSTGASFIRKNGKIILKKKVGSPTKVSEELELDKFGGYKFIGQVRWATYGSVTDENAQPHEVNCKYHCVGAHNGNISNTDSLKEFLIENNHSVLSDNDGEMLVHMIEHFFYEEINLINNDNSKNNYNAKYNNNKIKSNNINLNNKDNLNNKEKKEENFLTTKVKLFINAIRKSHKKVKGSYAACITADGIDGVFALKAGSSLYAGKGKDDNGEFIVVSSDLTSVLSKTRFLIPLNEGEGIYFTHNQYYVFSLNKDNDYERSLKRSKLNVIDVSLNYPYQFFMEQEISNSAKNIDPILLYYFEDNLQNSLFNIFHKNEQKTKKLIYDFLELNSIINEEQLKEKFSQFLNNKDYSELKKEINEITEDKLFSDSSLSFLSDEKPFLKELLSFNENYFEDLIILDNILIWKKKKNILKYKNEIIELFKQSRNNKIFFIGAGTSYHAALTGSYFFNEIAGIPVIAVNPGGFRSQFINSLNKNDILVFISQSGETKDLVDIINDVKKSYKNIIVISIVNNENSTIPQEKSEFYLPILCGPEIAVAATKSFTNQILLFYLLALSLKYDDRKVKAKINKVKSSIKYVLDNYKIDITNIANMLFLKPSIHILATSLIGLANEGALKIREVVLNHAQGFDAAEFKHGPNTILGKNTIFSLENLEILSKNYLEFLKKTLKHFKANFETKSDSESKNTFDDMIQSITKVLNVLSTSNFRPVDNALLNGNNDNNVSNDNFSKLFYEIYTELINIEDHFSNYPLVFVCPPDERDKRITISQIHTHKIRGADIFLIAQEDKELEKAVVNPPADVKDYKYYYLKLPILDDKYVFVFQTTIILQLLAFEMSVKKMKYLNTLKISNHGVHPDVPKNVSKSITVD